MNIVFILDNNYSVYLYTAMKSILLNADSNDKFVFWIMIPDLRDDVEAEINKLKNIHPFDINFIKINPEEELPYYKPWISYNSKLAYYRIYAPKVLSSYGVNRFMYLDADILVKGSLNELYNTDLGDFSVGLVPSGVGYDEKFVVFPRLKLAPNHKYAYSGLMLVDVDKYISDKIYEKSCDIAVARDKDLYWPDMDLLNMTLDGGNYKELKPKYSINPGVRVGLNGIENQGALEYFIKNYENIFDKKDIEEAYYKPVIWQLAGYAKPKYKVARKDIKFTFYDFCKGTIFEKQTKMWLPFYEFLYSFKNLNFKSLRHFIYHQQKYFDFDGNKIRVYRIFGIKFKCRVRNKK